MSGDSGNRGAEFINDGDKSSDGINFSDGDSNPYSAILDAAYGPMEGRVEQNESVERTSYSGDPVQNWQDARGAAKVSCDAYCRQVNSEHPSHVDSRINQPGYFGGGQEQVVRRPLTEIEQYQQRQRASHRGVENQWRGNGAWNQGQIQQPGGRSIVSISDGGNQAPGYFGGGNQWGNRGFGQQGDSVTVINEGNGQTPTVRQREVGLDGAIYKSTDVNAGGQQGNVIRGQDGRLYRVAGPVGHTGPTPEQEMARDAITWKGIEKGIQAAGEWIGPSESTDYYGGRRQDIYHPQYGRQDIGGYNRQGGGSNVFVYTDGNGRTPTVRQRTVGLDGAIYKSTDVGTPGINGNAGGHPQDIYDQENGRRAINFQGATKVLGELGRLYRRTKD